MIIESNIRPSLAQTLGVLRQMNMQERWVLVERGIHEAAGAIASGTSTLFFLVEDTLAGGEHMVRALYSFPNRTAFVEIPEEPMQRGGRFPTVLHALEIIAVASKHGGKENPKISFVQALREPIENPQVVLIPLTVDPNWSNVIALHPQIRHVDPEALARGYYEITKTDAQLPRDFLRHTMLVQALNGERPTEKGHVVLKVLSKEEARLYRLMHTGRIARWFDPSANRNITVRRF